MTRYCKMKMLLLSFFAQIASDLNYDSLEILKHHTDLSTILDHKKLMRTDFFPIEPFRMEGLLSRVKRTSPGSDNIPNWLFQKCSFEIADVCAYLFNDSFQTGTVPKQWRTAIVCFFPNRYSSKAVANCYCYSNTKNLSTKITV